jgi:hypothetical protein
MYRRMDSDLLRKATRLLLRAVKHLWTLFVATGLAFLSRPLALAMSVAYLFLAFTRQEHRYPGVPRVVPDRAKIWYVFEIIGLFLFYRMIAAWWPSLWSAGMVAAGLGLTAVFTIAFPTGDLSVAPFPWFIRNYVPMLSGVTVAERRAFLSQMSLRRLLHAGSEGAYVCVIEGLIGYGEIIAVAMYTLHKAFVGPAGSDAFHHPKHAAGSLFDFFYFTIVTVTTIGYGDWSPRTILTKAVCVGTVILAIAYVGAILTPAFGIAAKVTNRSASLFRTRRRDVVEDASRFLLALRAARRTYPAFAPPVQEDSSSAASRLALSFISKPLADASDLVAIIQEARRHVAVTANHDHTPFFGAFGPHWEAYGAISDIVGQHGYGGRTEIAIRNAVAHRCYGDLLLARAIDQLRSQPPISYIPHSTLRLWLRWNSSWRRLWMPLSAPVNHLNVWHTALAFRFLVASPDADAEGIALHDIGEWLYRARVRRQPDSAWSWSTLAAHGPAPIVCVDTTSLVYEALAGWVCSHVKRRHVMNSAERFLATLESAHDGLLPTFVWREGASDGCPIVTARVVSLLSLPVSRLRAHWSAIADRLEVTQTTPSPWFTARAISIGLVASYVTPDVVARSVIQTWAKELSAIVYEEGSARECIAAALLGLLRLRGVVRDIRVARALSNAVVEGERRLVNLCRSNEDPRTDSLRGITGPWMAATPLCYFGMGRRYADPLWSATLCATALLRASAADDIAAVPTSVV